MRNLKLNAVYGTILVALRGKTPQTEFARKLGMSQSKLSRIELAEGRLSIEELYNLENYFNLKHGTLYGLICCGMEYPHDEFLAKAVQRDTLNMLIDPHYRFA